jgi:hypothetical protein
MNAILQFGRQVMDCGQETLLLSLLLTQDGSIFQQTPFHSTIPFLVSKALSEPTSQPGLTILKVHLTIGFTKDQMMNTPGSFLKKSGDG